MLYKFLVLTLRNSFNTEIRNFKETKTAITLNLKLNNMSKFYPIKNWGFLNQHFAKVFGDSEATSSKYQIWRYFYHKFNDILGAISELFKWQIQIFSTCTMITMMIIIIMMTIIATNFEDILLWDKIFKKTQVLIHLILIQW